MSETSKAATLMLAVALNVVAVSGSAGFELALDLRPDAELSVTTFWTFLGEFSPTSLHGQRTAC
jgi:hypothetical protein